MTSSRLTAVPQPTPDVVERAERHAGMLRSTGNVFVVLAVIVGIGGVLVLLAMMVETARREEAVPAGGLLPFLLCLGAALNLLWIGAIARGLSSIVELLSPQTPPMAPLKRLERAERLPRRTDEDDEVDRDLGRQ